jgi:hypothetical protein
MQLPEQLHGLSLMLFRIKQLLHLYTVKAVGSKTATSKYTFAVISIYPPFFCVIYHLQINP